MNSIDLDKSGRESTKSAWKRWIAAASVAMGVLASATAASAETRSLKIFNLHTKDKAEIVFKRNGRYDPAGLKKVNYVLRDWRRNEPTKMDPRLLDLIWEAYRASGSRDYLHVVSAYRSPKTNAMLRGRSKGVAEKSQHMLGKAMDFYLPDVKLKTLRNIGLKLQTGGVGYYPTSGSPFVHMDVGNVRHWPKISRQELVSVFPNGKTLHVPSDGKPLPGYDVALASYKSRRSSGSSALALASAEAPAKTRSGGLLAALFGGGADEEEDVAEVAAPKPSKAVAAAAPARSNGKIVVIPPDQATPATAPFQEAAPEPEAQETVVAALPTRDIPLPIFAPRPKAEVAPVVPFGTAQAEIATPTTVDDIVAEEVAANVPVPTWRPEYKPSPAAVEDDPVLLAMAAPDDARRALGIPVPEARPEVGEFSVASLAADDGPQAQAETIEAAIKSNNERLAVLSSTASPRDLVVARPEGTDPTQAVAVGAKTTRKSARASVQDSKPAPKPQVVQAQPDSARWAMHSGEFVAATASAEPSVAHSLVRTAPIEVYSAGFQQGAQVADAGRFSGKAVSFMPVARFETN